MVIIIKRATDSRVANHNEIGFRYIIYIHILMGMMVWDDGDLVYSVCIITISEDYTKIFV